MELYLISLTQKNILLNIIKLLLKIKNFLLNKVNIIFEYVNKYI